MSGNYVLLIPISKNIEKWKEEAISANALKQRPIQTEVVL